MVSNRDNLSSNSVDDTNTRADTLTSQPAPSSPAGNNVAGNSGGKRRGLGRGLSALIVDTQHAPAPSLEEEDRAPRLPEMDPTTGVRQILLDQIVPNPQQPRTYFDAAALEELAASIRAHGIIQPLIVTRNPQESSQYWLIAGERRWRAARLALLEAVPAIVREASPLQLVEWALVENLQRADLNPLEEAAAYQVLMDEFTLTQAEIGQRVGKSRSAVANTIRLLQLPHAVRDALLEGRISAGHARALLALPAADAMQNALERILTRDLTVRQTEELVKQMLTHPPETVPAAPTPAQEQDSNLSHLESRFRDVLGTRVNLARNRDGTGRLIVHFYNDEDLTTLYQLLVGEEDSNAGADYGADYATRDYAGEL